MFMLLHDGKQRMLAQSVSRNDSSTFVDLPADAQGHTCCPTWYCCCRGKFDCGFYSDCMQVTNKQTSAEIPYHSIQHVLVSTEQQQRQRSDNPLH